MNNEEKIRKQVSWIPAHPCSESFSMIRYWRFLLSELKADDPFFCHQIMSLPASRSLLRGSALKRALSRKVLYPIQVHRGVRGAIAHILDHSWADMFDYVPKGFKKVATVHDLIPLQFPGELTSRQLRRFQGNVSRLHDADALIAVSNHTKREIIRLLGIPSEKIFVVPNGVSPPPNVINYGRITQVLGGVSGHFVVGSVGSTLERKNLEVLPRLVSEFQRRSSRPVVVLRAGDSLPATLRSQLLSALGAGQLIELGRVSDGELEEFYAQLDMLVVPSFYEGFGLPLLEAMARRVPVLAARVPSLAEVGGDAVKYFEPTDAEEGGKAMSEFLEPDVASHYRNEGAELAGKFTWRKTLEGFYSVYRQVA